MGWSRMFLLGVAGFGLRDGWPGFLYQVLVVLCIVFSAVGEGFGVGLGWYFYGFYDA